MIRVLVLAAGLASAVMVDVRPAAAYDPCVRATRDYNQAYAAWSAYCEANRVNRFLCLTPGARGARLYEAREAARERMARACRN